MDLRSRLARHRPALLACGVAGPIVLALVVAVLAALQPGYDQARDVLSELAAVDAANPWAMRLLGFGVLGVSLAAFGGGLAASLPGWRVRAAALLLAAGGLALVAVGLLPCDPGCHNTSTVARLHSPMASVAAVALGLGLLGFLLDFALRPGWRGHAAFTLACMVVAGFAGWRYNVVLGTSDPFVGGWQKLSLAATLVWVEVTALRLLRAPS